MEASGGKTVCPGSHSKRQMWNTSLLPGVIPSVKLKNSHNPEVESYVLFSGNV